MNNVSKRITADIILLLSVLFLPWWVTIILALALTFYFEFYYEFIIAAILIDMLYGVPQEWSFNLPLEYSIFSIVVFMLIQWVKTRLR